MFFKKKNKRVPALSMQWEHASFMLSNVDFLIESLDGETILTRTAVCHRQLS